jgi:hypothetical protein
MVIWGPIESSQSADGRLHVCNRPDSHPDNHECKCGDRNVQEALVREYEELVGYAAETERDMEFFKSKIHTHLARLDKILRGEKP